VGVERAYVEQKDVGDVVAVELLGEGAEDADVLVGDAEVGVLEGVDGGGVVLGYAAGVGSFQR
jgi:hypothetical protein